jgi:hypothetical protein
VGFGAFGVFVAIFFSTTKAQFASANTKNTKINEKVVIFFFVGFRAFSVLVANFLFYHQSTIRLDEHEKHENERKDRYFNI